MYFQICEMIYTVKIKTDEKQYVVRFAVY